MAFGKSKDLHTALKTEVIQQASINGVDWALVRLQYTKTDIAYSLHANPTSYSSAGIQKTDYLGILGFSRSRCSFLRSMECYSSWVNEKFDLMGFTSAFTNGYRFLEDAEKKLNSCGLYLDMTEGYGFHFGKPSSVILYSKDRYRDAGDGHTASHLKILKTSEDDFFYFAMSFISNQNDERKGFVIHYRPKHTPLSAELQGVMSYFKMKSFMDCPVFDFEGCYWWFIRLEHDDGTLNGTNAGYAHRCFDSHETNFSSAAKLLIQSDAEVRRFGFKLLASEGIAKTTEEFINQIKPEKDSSQSTIKVGSKSKGENYEFDVALSFAGTERPAAERLADILRKNGYKVFYDYFYPEQLWGRNLVDLFDDIFRKRSKYCVIFMSVEYNNRMWTNHERQSAQAKALETRGKEYILPIKVDTTELPGMPPTIGYLDLNQFGIEKIADMLLSKLKGTNA